METPSQSLSELLEPLFAYALGSILAALAAACVVLWRRRQRLGRPLARESGSPLARRVAITVACVLAVGMILHWGELELAWLVLVTLLLATLALAICPSEDEACIGELGVARGWDSRSLRELEEWRLTGEHLRWRVGTRWLACRMPVAEHAALRERLVAACGERESRFRD
ncbi:MAG: hypothetical protein HUU28_15110 [Planctomycetaceae bacterium]|nr:hypothetical protein [Planctomycetaceae bacterium]